MADTDMIPKARLDAEIQKRKDAEARASSLQEQLTTVQTDLKTTARERDGFKAQAEGVPGLQEQVAALQSKLDTTGDQSAAHIAMLEAGVRDASVRDYLLFQYDRHRSEAGEKAQEWSGWWAKTVEEPPAVLATTLADGASAPVSAETAPTAVDGKTPAPEAATTAPPPVSGEQAGVRPTPTPPSPWSPGSIARMGRDEWAQQKDELLAGLDLRTLF